MAHGWRGSRPLRFVRRAVKPTPRTFREEGRLPQMSQARLQVASSPGLRDEARLQAKRTCSLVSISKFKPRRPDTVCVCSCFPSEPIPIQTRVIILQHPNEESRCLATVPLLEACLPRDKLHIVRGKVFGHNKSALLNQAIASPNSLLLYPGKEAVDLKQVPGEPIGSRDDSALIVLDGTWAQAKGIFANNPRLHHLKQVQLSVETKSEYVIRTQPTKHCLSTLECVAHALAWLEGDPAVTESLLLPLRALCQYQLSHGAVVHHSKDDPNHIPIEARIQAKKEARKNEDRT